MKSLKLLPSLALALALAAALAACANQAGPQTSGVETPSAWSRLWSDKTVPALNDPPLISAENAAVEQLWWRSFGDATLNRLIDGALANNKSLRIAEARVAEVRAGRRGTAAALWPEISARGGASRGNQGLASSDKRVDLTEANLQASWELDLFGKNQARLAEATAIVESEDARRQAAMVALLAEVARNYFDLRNIEEQIAITTRNLITQQRTLDLTKAQLQGAVSSDLDVQRAAAQVSTTSAQLPALRAAYEVTLNHLNLLLGRAPGAREDWLEPGVHLPEISSRVLIAAPAAVLANRPDVRAAERQFSASISASDAAAREIYPTISLTALFGLQESTPFSATPWGIGVGLIQPVLNFGRIQSSIDAANARQTQAFLAYQETVLGALEDMENALSLYLHETSRRRDLVAAAEQNQRAVYLADQRYKAGDSGLLDLLVAQRNGLDAESSLASSNAQLRKYLVRVFTAAGGGWKL